MTPEEKTLLLKDLCARLPYGVKVNDDIQGDFTLIGLTTERILTTCEVEGCHNDFPIENIKPYLFPLSSMSDEMVEELNANVFFKYRDTFANVSHLISNGKITEEIYTYIDIESISYLIELFHKHHIDYNGLIEKGLALDATGLNVY